MDFITKFILETEQISSPRVYRLWGAISCVAGALERRCYTINHSGRMFCNLYVVLVGRPASGKTQVISKVRNVWGRIPELKLAPDNVNKASLIEYMRRVPTIGTAGITTPICFPIREFGVLFEKYELAFLSFLNDVYDNPPIYTEQRISVGERKVEAPLINLIGGSQPDFLASFLPDAAWGMGFTSRLMLVYQPGVVERDSFDESEDDKGKYKNEKEITTLASALRPIVGLNGEFSWSQSARVEFNSWNRQGRPPVPPHERLDSYNGRRKVNGIKLACISAASGGRMQISLEDFQRGLEWMYEIETLMPGIFDDVTHRTDSTLLEDMAAAMAMLAGLSETKLITKTEIYRFFAQREKVERIDKLIGLAINVGILEKHTLYDEYRVNLGATKRGPRLLN